MKTLFFDRSINNNYKWERGLLRVWRPSPRRGRNHEYSKPVIQYLNGVEIRRHDSIAAAAAAVGVSSTCVRNVCKGRKKTTAGYTFQTVPEKEPIYRKLAKDFREIQKTI